MSNNPKELTPGMSEALREFYGEPPEVDPPSSITSDQLVDGLPNEAQLAEDMEPISMGVAGLLPQHSTKTRIRHIIVRKDGTTIELKTDVDGIPQFAVLGIVQFLSMVAMMPSVAGYIEVDWSALIKNLNIEAYFVPGHPDTRMYVGEGYGSDLIIFLEDPGARLNQTIPTNSID